MWRVTSSAGRSDESGYTEIDRTVDPSSYISRLDKTGASDFWQAIKRKSYDLLRLLPGGQVLDVGCGTGDDTRALAVLVGTGGRVVGIDRSATMLDEARRRAADMKLSVRYTQADCNHLCFAEGTFDGCRCERVLQHLARPDEAVTEMIRVLRPGGRLALVEPDYGAMAIVGADVAVTRAIVECRQAHFRSGRIGRDLPGLLKVQGLTDLSIALIPQVSHDLNADTILVLREKFVEPAVAAGAIAIPEGERWLADLQAAAATHRFRHTTAIFVVAGKKA